MKTYHREDTSFRKHYSVSKGFLRLQPDLIYAGHSVKKHGWCEKVHSHSFCEILFITGGRGKIEVDGKTLQVEKGDIIVYNANCPHAEESIARSPLDFFFCAFDKFLLSDFPPSSLSKEAFCVLNVCNDKYEQLFDKFSALIYEQSHKELFYDEISNLISHHILLFVLRLISADSGGKSNLYEHHILKRTASFLDENYMHKLSLEEIAAACYVSKFYLSHLFKEHKGVTVGDYLRDLRIKKAENFLSQTDYPVSEIAFMCGFHNVHYFYRVFKTQTGKTPSEYRKKGM